MGSVITFGVSLVLLGLFTLVTMRERASGVRILGSIRSALDAKMERAGSALKHVHVGLVLSHVFFTYMRELVHEVVHIGLATLKVLERALMRTREGVQKSALSPKSQTARSHFLEALARFRKKKDTTSDTAENEEVG